MIRTSYIQEFSLADQVMGESYYLLLESKDTLDALIKLENTITSKEFFGESVEGELIMLESEKKNIFTRIGELIISTFNSFIEFLKDIGNSIKDTVTGVRKKTSDDGFKNAMRENPELAQEFMKAVLSGNIKAHDVKDMNALISEAQSITNDLLTGKIDNKTKEEKIDEALEKFRKRAVAITALISVPITLINLGKGIDWAMHHKGDRQAQETRAQAQETRAQAQETRAQAQDNRQRQEDIIKHLQSIVNGPVTKTNFLSSLKQAKNDGVIDYTTYSRMLGQFNMAFGNFMGKTKERIEELNNESFLDEVDGDFFTEAAVTDNIMKAIQKVLNFFTDHIGFCTKAAADLKDIETSISEKAKAAKDSNDGTIINQALAGIRKVMGAVTKELNGIKNLANTAKAKLG